MRSYHGDYKYDNNKLMDKEVLKARLRELLENRKEIAFAYLFGSFLEGEGFRDVDVALYLSPPMEPLKVLEEAFANR